MIDPLSLAGLTIAVIDELIKLSVFTAQLVNDAKAFDEVRLTHNLVSSADTSPRTRAASTV